MSVSPPNDPKLGDENGACRLKGMTGDFANKISEEFSALADNREEFECCMQQGWTQLDRGQNRVTVDVHLH